MSVAVRSMSFSVKTDVLDRLTAYCKERGCSRSEFVSKAVNAYLAEYLEDEADYEDAVAAWNEFEESGGASYSAEEVRKELGL